MTLEDLLKLSGASLADAASALDADPDEREEVEGYEGLADLDLVEAPGGARIYLRGEDVVVIYLGRRTLPEGTDADAVEAAVGSAGVELRSRQGKRAHIHVVADQGVAWSELDGTVGFIELFPPTTFEDYQATIYDEPGPFIR
jgi:hypothetical protein